MSKYIIDLPDAYTSKSALFGDILSIPICLEGGKRYGIPTGIKLEPYAEPDEDEIRQMAHEEAWEFAKQVSIMNPEDKRELWGTEKYNTINFGYSYHEAKAKYEKWKKEKEKEKIHVGDEVWIMDAEQNGVVTNTTDSGFLTIIDEDGDSIHRYDEDVVKTNRHYPEVEKLLEQMRGRKQ